VGGGTLAVVQSCYVPWKGYFDLIRHADLFVLFDDAQYTVRDWRNRNRIKTKDGVKWLSIPVEVSGRRTQRIRDVRIADAGWRARHWKTIAAAYARAGCFRDYRDELEAAYARAASPWLSEVNRQFTELICRWLGISTPLAWSSDFALADGRNTRLIELCLQTGARTYLSGPSARGYLDLEAFAAAGVEVAFIDYTRYTAYPQVHLPFEHRVSALDLVLNTGPDARRYLLPAPPCKSSDQPSAPGRPLPPAPSHEP